MEHVPSPTLKAHEFSGGIDLDKFAAECVGEPLTINFVKGDKVQIPLDCHVGRASIPCVEVGQRVRQFETIARANGEVSVDQHAPCSAVVSELLGDDASLTRTPTITQIVLECDGREETVKNKTASFDLRSLSADTTSQKEIAKRIAAGGVVGMGGAGFPAQLKLLEGMHAQIEDFVINAVECEPLASGDRYVLEHYSDEVRDGAMMIKALLNPKRTVLALGAWADAEAWSMMLRGTGIEVLQASARYPAGSEKQLIKILKGVELPLNQLPIHIGVVCFNVATLQAMYRAAQYGQPCIARTLTVNGQKKTIVNAPIGMSIARLLEQVGEPVSAQSEITSGGMMMGRLVSLNSPVTKLTHEISVHDHPLYATESKSCIRCGECAAVCPVRLQPQRLYEFSTLNDVDSIQEFGLFDCIECGCCSYVCPSKIRLVECFVAAKQEVNGLSQQARERQLLRARHHRHLARESKLTPAEYHAKLAEIPATDTESIDNELEKLKARISQRRRTKSDHDE